MISAQAADAHRFGRVKRNGYDPAEVDAVVARLVETLRSYERTTAGLEERLEEADVSADAIRRTFIAAEQTRDEIIASARERARAITDEADGEAARIVEAARSEAATATERAEREVTALADLADRLEREMAATRASLMESAEHDAEAVRSAAELDAAGRTLTSAEQAQHEIRRALATIESERRRAGLSVQAASLSAAWIRREAAIEARDTVARAEARADQLIAEADRERTAILEHVATLRTALQALDTSAAQLAAITAARGAIIDLAEIERLERDDIDLAAVDLGVIEQLEPVGAPVLVEGGRLDEPRHLRTVEPAVADAPSVPETTEPVEPPDRTGEVTSPDDDPTTYYQRSTGIPLSERVRLARRSG